jgi:hypothetical protein
MPDIGDFVISDGMVTSIDVINSPNSDYTYTGRGLGSHITWSQVIPTSYTRDDTFRYHPIWRSRFSSRRITLKDLIPISEALKYKYFLNYNIRDIKTIKKFLIE